MQSDHSKEGVDTVLTLPKKLTEESWYEIQKNISFKYFLKIDATNTEWTDPIPFLALSTILKKQSLDINRNVEFKINPTEGNIAHKRFLKFLFEHGFVYSLKTFCVFFDYRNKIIDVDFIKTKIIKENVDLHIENARCIAAKIVPCSEIKEHGIDSFINGVLEEAAEEVSIKTSLKQNIKKDYAIQKLRNLLRELVENVVNHAYSGLEQKENGSVGIFARIRRSKSNKYEDQNNELYKLENKCVLIKKWNRDYSHEDSIWIELFVVDAGVGILSNLESWKVSGEEERIILSNLIKNKEKSPLRTLLHKIFSGGFSSSARGNEKTFITGLQLVYESLKNHTDNSEASGDFIRLITGSEVLASHVPFPKMTGESSCYRKLTNIIGTYYHAAIEISPEEAILPENYHAPTSSQLSAIKEEILGNEIDDISIDVVDQRHLKEQGKDLYMHRRPHSYKPSLGLNHVVWLPPESIDKHDIKSWLEYCVDKGFKSLTIADIPAHRAYMFDFIVGKELFFDKKKLSELDVYIITRSWWISHYTTDSTIGNKRKFKAGPCFKRESLNLDKLCKKLRECDSNIFWKNVVSENKKSFLNKVIEWTNKNRASDFIDGYIDFSKALSDKYNYKIIKAAYERILPLWDNGDVDFVTTDGLLSPIAHDLCFQTELNYLSDAIEDKIKKKIILIGSVKVTGETNTSTNRIASAQSNVEILDEIYVLIHKNAGNTDKFFRLLNWNPDIEIDREEEVKYKRIDGTPFVRKGGLSSYQIIKGSDTQSAKQMYSELTRGYLKLGHWDYSGSHDLFTINLSRVISTCHESTAWMAKNLEDNYKYGVDNLLIYISHPVTQKLISTLRDQFGGTLEKYTIFPLQKVNIGISQQTFFSPLVLEEIEEVVKKSNKKNVNLILLDDGKISGNTLRDAEEALYFDGRTDIKTVVLLDRSGYPSTKSKLNKYSERHKSFWRWDMPSMGNKGHCPLCACLDSASTMERILSDEFSRRIQYWITTWKCKKVVDLGWDITGHEPTRLLTPYDMAIGHPSSQENHFEHINSTTLSSMAVEISRSTLRVDFPLEKFYRNPKPEKKVPIAASIEAICTQLLILGDAIPVHVQLEYYVQILRSIWFIEGISNIKNFASLSFFHIDELLAPGLWDEVKNLIISHGFLNIDCQIISTVIYQKTKLKGSVFERFELVLLENNIRAKESISLLEILVDRKKTINISRSLNTFFKICGEGPATTHEGELDVTLNLRGEKISSEGFKSRLYELLKELSSEISSLEDSQCISHEKATCCIRYINNVLQYLDKLSTIKDAQVSKIYGKIFKDDGLRRIWEDIIIHDHDVEDYIYSQIAKFNNNKLKYIDEKGKDKFVENWTDKHLPEVVVDFDEENKEFSSRYLFVSQARRTIYDLVCNSIYAKHGILSANKEIASQAIFVSFKKDCLEISFKNFMPNRSQFSLVPKSYSVIFQKLGGAIETRFYDHIERDHRDNIKLLRVYEAVVKIPSIHIFRLREHGSENSYN